jgi:hypothetical protein
VRSPPRPESVAEAEEVFLVDRVQHVGHGALNDLILQRRHTASELHSYPIDLWDRLKSRIRFIPCVGGGSSF